MNYRQIKAIEKVNKDRILDVCPTNEESGVYVFHRYEDGMKYAYVGQARHLLSRLAQHLTEYDHIGSSLKKRKFYSLENETGWKITVYPCAEYMINEKERYYIKLYANAGYQLYNVTSGGQDKGKIDIRERKASKGYRDGLKQGYANAQKYVSNLFDKNLAYSINGKDNRLKQKALEKFTEFIK